MKSNLIFHQHPKASKIIKDESFRDKNFYKEIISRTNFRSLKKKVVFFIPLVLTKSEMLSEKKKLLNLPLVLALFSFHLCKK